MVPDLGTRGRHYLAFVAELPGCESHGDTPAEALENLEDAMALYIQSLLEDGLGLPFPRPAGNPPA